MTDNGGWDVFLKHFQKLMKWKSVFYIHGPSKSFRYPNRSDILIMSRSDVLTAVNPTTTTGRTYVLTTDEMNGADSKLDDSKSE